MLYLRRVEVKVMYHIGDWVVRSSGAGKEDNSGRRTVFQFGRISLVLRVRACVRKEQN